MTKQELIDLIQSLKLEEVKELKITYYVEKKYFTYDNREPITLTINNKGE